jgi:hypothetical protein
VTVDRSAKRPLAARIRRRSLIAALAALAAVPAAASAQEPSVRAGHSIAVMHNVDFVAATGYGAGTPMRVEVFRGPHRIGSASGIAAATAEGPGLEVNHGPEGTAQQGDCWDTFTPDVRPGDRIVVSGDGGQDVVFVDRILVDEVVAGTAAGDENVYVRGVARYADGRPIPVAALDSAEVRGDGGATRANPTRPVARIGDPAGDRWEAVYEAPGYGVFRGTPSKLSILTGDHAMGYGHLTIPPPPVVQLVEGPDAPGPALGCEGAPAAPASAITATDDAAINLASGDLEVSGVAAGAVTAVSATLSSATATLAALPENVSLTTEPGGKAWTARFTRAQLERLPDGAVTVTAGFQGADPATHARTIAKDVVAPAAPTATPPSGTYATAQRVQLVTADADDVIRFTRDGTAPTADSPRSSGVISGATTQTITASATDAAGNAGPAQAFSYAIVSPADAPAPQTAAPVAAPGGALAPIATVPAPLEAAPPSSSRPYLRSFGTLPRIRRSVASRSGIRVVMRVGDDARVVRIRVLRKLRNGRRLALATTVRTPRRAGVFRVVLRSPSLRRGLRVGSYELEATPGASRASLGTPSRFGFAVIKG